MNGSIPNPAAPPAFSVPTAEPLRSDRVRAVFGLGPSPPLPGVSPDSLERYRQHLAQLLDGIPRTGRYQEAGRFQSDPIVLIGISPWVDDTRGILAQIAGDSLSGEVPLLGVRLDATEDFCEVIEDYRWWWGHHRPTEARLTPSRGNQSTVPLTRSWIADSFTPDEI